MSKLLFLCVFFIYFLTLGLIYYKNVAEEERDFKQLYSANNQVLITRIKKVYDDKVATDLRIKELEEEAIKDKGVFDWNIDISNTNVIKGLKK